MAPMLRSRGPRRRARVWATPFVVTFALSSASCSKTTEPGDPRSPPPPPIADAAAHAPPPPPDAAPSASVAYLGELHRSGAACTFEPHFACPPTAKCNPPAPLAVPCPSGLQHGEHGRVTRLPDTTCELALPDGCPKTDPAPPCNPPAPVPISCP
jgi:hypothetical protein